VDISSGVQFRLYLKYNNVTLYSDQGNAALLHSKTTEDKEIMVIGFEDNVRSNWKHIDGINSNNPDFNDVVVYIEGNPELPNVESKRFFCEDLGAIGDFDYNDLVFDVHPLSDTQTEVTIRAVGGTLPIWLYWGKPTDSNPVMIGGNELHTLFRKPTTQSINVGTDTRQLPLVYTIDKSALPLADFTSVFARVQYDDGEIRDIPFSTNTETPAIIAVPVSVKWLKEDINIRRAYPNFFNDGWYESDVDTQYIMDLD